MCGHFYLGTEVDESWVCVIAYNVSATNMTHKCMNTADYCTSLFHVSVDHDMISSQSSYMACK